MTAHSLRAAANQYLNNLGVPSSDIEIRGGWKSSTNSVRVDHYTTFRLTSTNFTQSILDPRVRAQAAAKAGLAFLPQDGKWLARQAPDEAQRFGKSTTIPNSVRDNDVFNAIDNSGSHTRTTHPADGQIKNYDSTMALSKASSSIRIITQFILTKCKIYIR